MSQTIELKNVRMTFPGLYSGEVVIPRREEYKATFKTANESYHELEKALADAGLQSALAEAVLKASITPKQTITHEPKRMHPEVKAPPVPKWHKGGQRLDIFETEKVLKERPCSRTVRITIKPPLGLLSEDEVARLRKELFGDQREPSKETLDRVSEELFRKAEACQNKILWATPTDGIADGLEELREHRSTSSINMGHVTSKDAAERNAMHMMLRKLRLNSVYGQPYPGLGDRFFEFGPPRAGSKIFPYQKAMLDALADPEIKKFVFTPRSMGKTSLTEVQLGTVKVDGGPGVKTKFRDYFDKAHKDMLKALKLTEDDIRAASTPTPDGKPDTAVNSMYAWTFTDDSILNVDDDLTWHNPEEQEIKRTDEEKHEWYMGFARHAATGSKDSTKVGAAIISPQGNVLGVGYNGCARGVKDYPSRYEHPKKQFFMCHAEKNAIDQAASEGVNVGDAWMYVTRPPCAACAASIIQAGITHVFYEGTLGERWADSRNAAMEQFEEAGVHVRRFPFE